MRHLALLVFILILFSRELIAQVPGCTDPAANNYNPAATINDGSCTYNATAISPASSQNLDGTLDETSGLILWNNNLWTHNDNSDLNLYSLDTLTGTIYSTLVMNNTVNIDWEEISQDSNYVYIGDFGNNVNGNRTNLKILRIEKSSILLNIPVIDTIQFIYSDQVDFTPTGANNTDYDCEAFIVSSDSIYLFTKQWVSNGTNVYVIPKSPGTHTAQLQSGHNVQGLITGAVYMENQKLVVLSGYSNLLQPFIYCLYDFDSTGFFSGNKRKINLSLPFHQVEGIATNNGLKYYLTNEYFTQPPIITIPQKLHVFELNTLLSDYLNGLSTSLPESYQALKPEVFPNPAEGVISVRLDAFSATSNYSFTDISGKIVLTGNLEPGLNTIDISSALPGVYVLRIGRDFSQSVTIL